MTDYPQKRFYDILEKDRQAWALMPESCPSCGVSEYLTCIPALLGHTDHAYGCNNCGWSHKLPDTP